MCDSSLPRYERAMPSDYIDLAGTCFTTLLMLGLLLLGLLYVRKANAGAGFVLAGGAAFRMLTTCCVEFGGEGLRRSGNWDIMHTLSPVFQLGALLEVVVFWGAVVGAAIMLARALAAAAVEGGARV